MKRKVTIALLVLGAGYLLLCALLYFFQETMLFPGAMRPERQLDSVAGVDVRELALADGTRYRIAVAAPEKPRGVLAFYLGNGEDLSSGVYRAAAFAQYGLHTIVTEYPGYGASGGDASKASILAAAIRSAEAAREVSQAKQLPLFVGGQSLGTFSAVHAAHQGLGEKVLLASPPTSIAEAGAGRYPFLPVRWLLKHPFDNAAKAPEVTVPVLVIHGDADTVVPHEMGQRLAQLFPRGELVTAKGVGHNSLGLDRSGPFGTTIEKFWFE